MTSKGQVITPQKWMTDKVNIRLQVTTGHYNYRGFYLKRHTDTSLTISVNPISFSATGETTHEMIGYKNSETIYYRRKGTAIGTGLAGFGIGLFVGICTVLALGDDLPGTHREATAGQKAFAIGSPTGLVGGLLGFTIGGLDKRSLLLTVNLRGVRKLLIVSPARQLSKSW